ncbi:MAG TPA: type 2 lanthipeptide synthetase LanM family protein [Longimicrobium sp.]|nr:type 2 lanthipeptide synthetase LanM family protein [Longimicrobium sp.]
MTDLLERTGAPAYAPEAAATLDDRLRGRFVPRAHPGDEAVVEARLAVWRELVSPQDEHGFARRLAWDGLDEDDARRLVAPAAPAEGGQPSWARVLAEAYGSTPDEFAAAFAALPPEPDRVLDPAEPVAFEPLFVPLVQMARAAVRARAGAAYDLLAPEAHRVFERNLLLRASRVCGRALYAGFAAHRAAARTSALQAIFGGAGGGRPTARYDEYVAAMRGGGLCAFFREYAVAARLCGTVTELWISMTAELIGHLSADLPELEARFGGGAPLGPVAEARLDLSDAHDGGRSVVVVRFASGARVVYKPRGLGLDRFWSDLLRWVNDEGALSLRLRSLEVVDRGTHGWLEFVEAGPCATIDEVRRFYRRNGMVLALVYAFNGNDFHFENLIACGEHPVLLDLEALLMHRLVLRGLGDQDHGSARLLRERFASSVVRTCLLPVLRGTGDERKSLDMGAMGGDSEPEPRVELPYWRHLNTDLMRVDRMLVEAQEAANRPRLDGAPQSVTPYADEVVGGFREAYEFLLARRDELLAPGGMLARIRGQRVRFLFRHTNLYATLLERTLHPAYLRDGADRALQLDTLARPLAALPERPSAWPILAAERLSMERMDIPLFGAAAESRDLELPTGERLENFFDASALHEVTERLERLGAADLEFQAEVITTTLRATEAHGLLPPRPVSEPAPPPRPFDLERFREDALSGAVRVAELLRERAVTSPEGGASWMGFGYLPRSRRHMPGPLGYGLFDGYGGVGLFLAAVGRVAGDGRFRALALEAVRPLRDELGSFAMHLRRRGALNLGAATGIASAVYSLARIAELADEPALLDTAAEIAAMLTPEVISRDDSFDLVSGAAGVGVALLALHGATGDGALVHQAAECGRHLLAHLKTDPASGLPFWNTGGDRTETGLAHGNAGIALALFRLFRATGDRAFLEAAEGALARDQQALREREGEDAAALLATWAYGLPGVAFAELEAPAGSPARARLRESLADARRSLPAGGDGLCAGSMGPVDLLVTAATALDDPELLLHAREGADLVLARAARRGGFATGWGPGVVHTGFFQGLPGIGYQLLRTAWPERLPSVLSWR